MSPCKPARDIKVHVPRHSSQRLGPAVTAQVQHLAKRRRMRVDVRQTAYEPSNILAQAIVSRILCFSPPKGRTYPFTRTVLRNGTHS